MCAALPVSGRRYEARRERRKLLLAHDSNIAGLSNLLGSFSRDEKPIGS